MTKFDIVQAEQYNLGIDTAIALIKECMDYEDRMTGKANRIICGLEASKKKIVYDAHESWCACSECRGIE